MLDTKILSNATKPGPSLAVTDWLSVQQDENLYIASLTIAEIRRGIIEKSVGRKRKQFEEWFSGREGPSVLFAGRILPFDEKAGLLWAKLMADGVAAGRSKSAMDMIIPATALANDRLIVTDNEHDFHGMDIFNPLRPHSSRTS